MTILSVIPLWLVLENPLSATLALMGVDLLAFYPTFKKAYAAPDGEVLSTYLIGSLQFSIGLFSLHSFSLEAVLYPASVIVLNVLFVTVVLFRRCETYYCSGGFTNV